MCILNTNVCMIRMSVIFFSRHAFCNTFSTHDLSWRSTDTIATMIAAITFQLTTSRGGRLTSITITSYCPVFQLTTSRGGRQAPANMSTTLFYFQLTTSRGGRLTAYYGRKLVKTFQLTTSRGGRQHFILHVIPP